MLYKTRSGSVYQVDHEGKRVRRMIGEAAPTPHQGKDGDWKSFQDLTTLPDGRLWFWWGSGETTFTSPVLETIEEN
jgi:hypothetical protein